jgi:membrane-associated protein
MTASHIIHTLGYAGFVGIIFAETGLLFGFFLPGDTLLITAGVLAARGQLHLPLLLIGGSVAAILGDTVGYAIGRQAGGRLFQRDDSFWFRREHIERAQHFYERHGGKTIFLARFLFGVRTCAPVVAGAAHMPYRRFAAFNVAGGLAWVCGITLLAYAFGGVVSTFDRYIFMATLVVLPIPVLVAVVQYLRLRRSKRRSRTRDTPERSVPVEGPE